MKLNRELIAGRFIKVYKMTERTRQEDNSYMEGAYDLLDSITFVHPELVYDIHCHLHEIETQLEDEISEL